MNEILQKLEYHLTSQGTWCRPYSRFAENMILISHPRNRPAIKKPYSELDEIYIDEVTADYAQQIETCQGLYERIGDVLSTRCTVSLKIENGTVTRSLIHNGKVLCEDRFSYDLFHKLAINELFSFPKVSLPSQWYENPNLLVGLLLIVLVLVGLFG